MIKRTLSRAESLTGKVEISALFASGKRLDRGGIKLIYGKSEQVRTVPVKVLFSAPKKLFKRAVDRNKIKRRMREAYRLNKEPVELFSESHNINFNLMFVYQANQIMDFNEIQDKIVLLLNTFLDSHGKSD